MKRLGSFEHGKSVIDSSIFMVHNTESYKYIAKLEWLVEIKNREDLVKNGFKIKTLNTPEWMIQKCGKDVFEEYK